MTERPILFSGPMVRAILDGTKSQTRRLSGLDLVNEAPDEWRFDRWQDGYKDGRRRAVFIHDGGDPVGLTCRYDAPRLWVRETFRLRADQDDKPPSQDWWKSGAWYQADGNCEPSGCGGGAGKLRPSIHMPRWASRITLDVISVRVERLQDITEEDARAEGCTDTDPRVGSAWLQFSELWESVHGANGPKCWDANPWVWVIGFKREDSNA